MGTNYPGNWVASEPPGPAPAPFQVPTALIPSSGESGDITSLDQQIKTAADYIAYLMLAAGVSPTVAPTGFTGYGSVAQNGGGTGTVTPSGSVKYNTGHNIVIKIILGGAVGVATFQTSIDGGNTYGATQTTAASMTCATSGITLAFANNFVINTTYQFRGANTPNAVFVDGGGQIRHLIDHDGFPMGRRSEIRFEWVPQLGTLTADGAFHASPNDPRIAAIIGSGGAANGAAIANTTNTNDGGNPNEVLFTSGTNAANKTFISTAAGYFPNPTSNYGNVILKAECEVLVLSTANSDFQWGFADAQNPTTANNIARIRTRKATNANWWLEVVFGGAPTFVDTGVAISANNLTRVRLEIYGASTLAGGKLVVAHINEVRAFTSSGTPAGNEFFFFAGIASSDTTSTTATIGPVLCTWNRWLNPPKL